MTVKVTVTVTFKVTFNVTFKVTVKVTVKVTLMYIQNIMLLGFHYKTNVLFYPNNIKNTEIIYAVLSLFWLSVR